ncbi:LRA5 [Symbiodinium sp. KB8]|nr:LRA5 [Symbiodinium sp. KB8]
MASATGGPGSDAAATRSRVVAVTGGAQGIGFGIAKMFARDGCSVALLDMNKAVLQLQLRKRGPAAAIAHPLLRGPGLAETLPWLGVTFAMDVSSEADWSATVEVTGLGGLDVLVQSAGVTGRTKVLTHEVDPADFDFVMRVNCRGTFLGCRAVLGRMKAQGGGRVINIASIAGKEGNAGMCAYSTSKAAVIGMTKVMGKEYAETGVTVNAVAPAVVQTAMVDAMPAEQVKYMTDKIPMKRTGTIAEIASLVRFIASPDASFTTGFTFDATGGRAVY